MEVGQSVYADFGRYSVIDVRKGVVERVTPTGQIVISFNGNQYKFKGDRQIASDPWYKARILSDEAAKELLDKQSERVLRRKIRSALDDIKSNADKQGIVSAINAVLEMAKGLPE